MAGKKVFNTQDLVLQINHSNYDPIKYPLDEWGRFLDVLCGNREYQKEAILTALKYLISPDYKAIEDLVRVNYNQNDQLQLRYSTEKEYLSKLQLPQKRSANIDLATGTGKSYVMYGIAQIALGLGLVDKVLVLGPPSLTIEKELIRKFNGLSGNSNLLHAIPQSSKIPNPSIISADQTIKEGSICIENINAVYSNTGSSIFDSLSFGKGSTCLVLNDEVHHVYNKVEGRSAETQSIKKWREFLLDSSYAFQYILGFTGTAYVDNEYFNDIIYRYSLRSAIEDKYVKTINYVVENVDNSENEKFQKILHNHKRNKLLYPEVKPLTILITKDIRLAKQLKTRLVEFLESKGEGSKEFLDKNKVLLVTSDKDHKANVLKLPYVDNSDEPCEWIISVAMLTEGWDVKNVFQIVPMEEKAFNSKLLIAQVLGRGLRIPPKYPNAEVVVFNHDKWSRNIKNLVDEILEMETKVKNSPILDGERSKYHFTIYNVNYTKSKVEREIMKETGVFNYKDYIEFAAETFEHKTETKYVKIGDKEYSLPYTIEKEKFHINEIVDKIVDEFQIRKLEGITLKLDEQEYTSENLPDKSAIESIIRRSMARREIEGDYLGKRNRQAVFSAFNTLLRKKPKSIQLTKLSNSLLEVDTRSREHENLSLLSLKNDSTIFYTSNYREEIVIPDSLLSLEEIIQDEELPLAPKAFHRDINPFLFRTPIDLVFTTAKPERDFVKNLIDPDNAPYIDSWIKSKNQSFYSIEYSLTKGSHTTTHSFNPDFFVLVDDGEYQNISVVEIKMDNDTSDENKQKNRYATEHFKELNQQLAQNGIKQRYFFNFLSPTDFGAYFLYLRDRKLFRGKYKSELDILLGD